MDLPKSRIGRDKTIQLVRQDSQPLTLSHRLSLSCKREDIENLEEVIDVQRDLERYQNDTPRKIRPQQVYHMRIFESKNGLYKYREK